MFLQLQTSFKMFIYQFHTSLRYESINKNFRKYTFRFQTDFLQTCFIYELRKSAILE